MPWQARKAWIGAGAREPQQRPTYLPIVVSCLVFHNAALSLTTHSLSLNVYELITTVVSYLDACTLLLLLFPVLPVVILSVKPALYHIYHSEKGPVDTVWKLQAWKGHNCGRNPPTAAEHTPSLGERTRGSRHHDLDKNRPLKAP